MRKRDKESGLRHGKKTQSAEERTWLGVEGEKVISHSILCIKFQEGKMWANIDLYLDKGKSHDIGLALFSTNIKMFVGLFGRPENCSGSFNFSC